MIRLVASDMDGTLLAPDGTVTGRTADTIKRLQRAGIGFVVCTGRAYEDARAPLDARGISCDMICMNGAAVYDREGKCLFSRELEEEQIRWVLDVCRTEEPVFDFMTDQGSCTITPVSRFRDYCDRGLLLPMAEELSPEYIKSRFRFLSPEELFGSKLHFYKMSVIHENSLTLNRIKDRLMERNTLAVASSHSTNLEITDSGAQKGLALLQYAGRRGIKEREIMAVGDSENDRSMLSLPLGFTVVMENAMESMKRAARCQTRSNREDGAAYAMEMLALENS